MNNKIDFLPVLLGSDQNAYGMARSFHEAYGITSVAIGKGQLPATDNSRIVKVAVEEPRLEEDEVFVKTLLDYAASVASAGKKLLLVSCGDNYTKLLARNQDKLKGAYLFNSTDSKTYERLSIKKNFYDVCDEFGFDYPKTVECDYSNYKNIETPFEFPIVIKPSNSVAYWNCSFQGKKKVFIASSEPEFRAILDAIYSSSYKDTLVLQEFIPGNDDAMRVVNCYCGMDGKVRLLVMGNVLLEEHTAQGIGSYAAIIPGRDDALAAQIIGFLEKIGYTGFINIDLKKDCRDGTGKYKFFEMNLRQGRSSYFVTAAGYNLAKFLVDDVVYGKKQKLVIGEAGGCLWSIIPAKVIYAFVGNEELKAQAKALVKSGKHIKHLLYKPDMTPKRYLYFIINQHKYMKKYKENFQKKGYDIKK